MTMTLERFLSDPHAAKYSDVLRDHPDAIARLLEILDDPDYQTQLVDAEAKWGRSALSGVNAAIEADPRITPALASPRFRQAVGVAVRLTMEGLGWSKTGRKGSVRGSQAFTRAERYAPPAASGPAGRARAALDAVARIGDEDERAATGAELLDALAETRRTEGRAF